MARAARAILGLTPGELERMDDITPHEAGKLLPHIGKLEGPEDVVRAMEELSSDPRKITKRNLPLISAYLKMLNSIMGRSEDMTPGMALDTLAKELYETYRDISERRGSTSDFVNRTVGKYRGGIPESVPRRRADREDVAVTQAAEKGPSAALARLGTRCGVPVVRLTRPIACRLASGAF